jgi:hypothetical protein
VETPTPFALFELKTEEADEKDEDKDDDEDEDEDVKVDEGDIIEPEPLSVEADMVEMTFPSLTTLTCFPIRIMALCRGRRMLCLGLLVTAGALLIVISTCIG